jgi:hypothetical protein
MNNLFCILRDPNPDGSGGGGGATITAEAINGLQGDAFRNILPEDVRGAGWLKDVNTFGDFVKKSANAQTLIGQRAVPEDNAPPEQWNAWFQQIGRPADPKEYGVPEVPGVPKEYIQGAVETGVLAKILHAAGANKMMARTAMTNIIKETYAAEQKEKAAGEAAHEKFMNETFGKDRQAITENGKKYLSTVLPATMVPILNGLSDKELGVVLAMTNEMAKKFGQEDTFRGGKGGDGGGTTDTMETLTAQMRTIMSQKEYQDPLINKTKFMELQKNMEEIRVKMRKLSVTP